MSMRSRLPASLAAVLALLIPAAATAADLYGDAPRYGYDRTYEDYEGRYPDEDRRYGPRDYADRRYEEPRYGYGSTKDGDYLPPVGRPPRYWDQASRPGNACAPTWQIRNRLQADGWCNFEQLTVRRNTVILRAERPNGRAFELKLDRCTGYVIAERPARYYGYGAHRPGPRRFGWAY